ncbi:MAG: phosphoglycerate kinase [bacterium]|nr:phosphoglycerate kinase [bacterium]
MPKLSVKDIDVGGKKVFLRVDFNVPLNAAGAITDDTRIVASLPTIEYLIKQKAKVIIASHLGRPKGRPDSKYSLKPIADRLAELLGREVFMLSDCIGEQVQSFIGKMTGGQVVLLENLRFHAGEEENSAEFAAELAKNAEIYVDDAFGAAHRAHASITGVPSLLSVAVAGLLLGKEIDILESVLHKPSRPFLAIMGGAKVSDKIKVIENLLTKVDMLIIGGGLANTFLKALGYEMGTSLVENALVPMANELLEIAKRRKVEVYWPADVVVAQSLLSEEGEIVEVGAIPVDKMIVDIGPKTAEQFAGIISSARLVVWNGPLGVFENPAFSVGTYDIAVALSTSEAISIVGGGDSAAALEQLGLAEKITHISTGGGALLEFLEGKELPGIAVLNDKA